MNKISVIIPVYNVEKYIEKSISSVINQTLKDIEIIVVNDGTKDKSVDIVKNITKGDSRVKVIEKENGGLSSARNKGLEYATGEYIYFLDSDDYIELNMFEQVYNTAKKYDCDFVRFGYCRENNVKNTKDNIVEPLLPGEYDRERIIEKILNPMIGVLPNETRDSFINMSACFNLYKSEIIKKYNINFLSEREFVSEDYIFNIEFFKHANKGFVMKEVFYHYVKNEKSLTSSYKANRFENTIKLHRYLSEMLKNNDFCQDYQLRLDRAFINRTRECVKYELMRDDIVFFEKHKNVKNIVNNDIVVKTINGYPIKDMTFEYKMIFTLIKWRFSAILCLIYVLTGNL